MLQLARRVDWPQGAPSYFVQCHSVYIQTVPMSPLRPSQKKCQHVKVVRSEKRNGKKRKKKKKLFCEAGILYRILNSQNFTNAANSRTMLTRSARKLPGAPRKLGSSSDEGITCWFDQLSVSIHSKKETAATKILDGCSGVIREGSVVALLGPSGAGAKIDEAV